MATVGLSFGISVNFKDLELDVFLKAAELKLAAETGLALLKRRITVKSERADKTKLSSYSTKPIYIRTKGIGTGNPRAKPKGGRLSSTGKSMYFKGGYREFRERAGRNTRKDLLLSGNTLGKRFRVLRVSGKTVIVGWSPGSSSAKAAAGLHKQEQNKLFLWSDNEQESIARTAMFYVSDYLSSQGWAEQPTIDLKDLE